MNYRIRLSSNLLINQADYDICLLGAIIILVWLQTVKFFSMHTFSVSKYCDWRVKYVFVGT